MTINVRMGDGSLHKFPDGTSPDNIRLALQKYVYDQGMASLPGIGVQGVSGTAEGVANLLGAPVDLSNAASEPVRKRFNEIFGTDYPATENPVFGSEFFKRPMRAVGLIQPEDPNLHSVRRTAQSVGASIPLAVASGGVVPAAAILLSGLGGGLGGSVANRLFPGSAVADIIGDVGGSLISTGGILGAARQSARAAAARDAPSRAGMKATAGGLYDQAAASGVQANPAEVSQLVSDVWNIAKQRGFITSKGKVAESPLLRHVIDSFTDLKTDPLTGAPASVGDLRIVRQAVDNLAASDVPKEAAAGVHIKRRLDALLNNMAPELKTANAIYSQASKSETISKAMQRAELTAQKSQGTSYATALRNEFSGIAKDIIDNGPGGWTPDEVAMINQAARGSLPEVFMRGIGKMSLSKGLGMYTGLLSGAGGAAHLLSGAGSALLGPLAGLGVAAPLVGSAAQAGSNLLTRSSANLAELLTRSGRLPDITSLARRVGSGSLAAVLADQISRNRPQQQGN